MFVALPQFFDEDVFISPNSFLGVLESSDCPIENI
jgi:hypothetical protein